MKGRIEFIDRPKTNSEVKATDGSLLEIKTPARKVDTIFRDYKKNGFENVDGFFKRVNLDNLLEKNVPKVKENPIVDSNTTVADFTGFDKDSDKKGSALVGFYNNRQEKIRKAKITEIGK